MDGSRPAGGRWNLDTTTANRRLAESRPWTSPVPTGPARTNRRRGPPRPRPLGTERRCLVRRAGRPRLFPATREEALAALRHFIDHRLPTFGPYEDAMLAGDPVMSHSLLSSSLNLGLLDPMECVDRAAGRLAAGRGTAEQRGRLRPADRRLARVRVAAVLVLRRDYRHSNALQHTAPLPDWFLELDAEAVTADACPRCWRRSATPAGPITSPG